MEGARREKEKTLKNINNSYPHKDPINNKKLLEEHTIRKICLRKLDKACNIKGVI